MSKDKRYFDANHAPLKEDVTSPIELACNDINDWNKSACAGNLKWDGDTPSFKTVEELYTEQIPQLEEALYKACMDYQTKNIDINLDRVMSEANIIVKTTDAVEGDYPLCSANGVWLQGLWVEYFVRKTALIAGDEYSVDFADCGNVPNDYMACNTEVNG